MLFGALERAITHCGPIPVMLHEHAIGRALRARMGEAFRARDLESQRFERERDTLRAKLG